MKKFFYARVSTEDQNLDRQITQHESEGYVILTDKKSGKNTDRENLNRMFDMLREGDSVTVVSLDRLARSLKDLLNMVDELDKKGVQLIIKDMNIDTKTATGKLFLQIVGAIAEFELLLSKERQRAGIEIAKQKKKYKGRKPIQTDNFEEIYNQWKEDKISSTQAGKLLNMSRATFYRRIRTYEDNKPVDF